MEIARNYIRFVVYLSVNCRIIYIVIIDNGQIEKKIRSKRGAAGTRKPYNVNRKTHTRDLYRKIPKIDTFQMGKW